MQCACAILTFVVRPTVRYFSKFSYKRHDLKKKVNEHGLCNSCLKISYSKKIQRDTNINVYRSWCTAPVVLVRF